MARTITLPRYTRLPKPPRPYHYRVSYRLGNWRGIKICSAVDGELKQQIRFMKQHGWIVTWICRKETL